MGTSSRPTWVVLMLLIGICVGTISLPDCGAPTIFSQGSFRAILDGETWESHLDLPRVVPNRLQVQVSVQQHDVSDVALHLFAPTQRIPVALTTGVSPPFLLCYLECVPTLRSSCERTLLPFALPWP